MDDQQKVGIVIAAGNSIQQIGLYELSSQILSNQRDEADKAEGLVTLINKAVVLVRRDKDNTIPGYRSFPLFACDHPLPGKNKYLVFPRVRMRWCGATGLELEDTHTEVWRAVIGGNNLALDYPG